MWSGPNTTAQFNDQAHLLSALQSPSKMLVQDLMDFTAYPPAPAVGMAAGPARLRDDPLVNVLPQARPDGSAELLADAITAKDEVEVHRLLAGGASASNAPKQGRNVGVTPLALAIRGTGTLNIACMLLEAGASVQNDSGEPGLSEVLQAWTNTFVNPVDNEAEVRAKLRLILDHGGDINGRIAHSGHTALHLAAAEFQRRRLEGVGPRMNRWTTKRTECAKLKFRLLVQAGADPLARNRCNQTPVDLVSADFRAELPEHESVSRHPL